MEQREKEAYHEPLLITHEPLRDLTGNKYLEKTVNGENGNFHS